MVDDVEPHAVEVGHLAQLLGQPQLEPARARDELVASHEHVLVVVRGHKRPGAIESPSGVPPSTSVTNPNALPFQA